MTNDFFAPVNSVSKSDRDRAEQRLREAHQFGLIDAAEFEARMSRVITADRLEDLAAATDGPLPTESAGQQRRSYSEPMFSGAVQAAHPRGSVEQGTGMAVLAHLSPFLTWLIGPAVIWAISAKGSFARREAAKAFNWQLLAVIVGAIVGIVGGALPGDGNPIAAIWTVIWVVLTVIGAAKAAKGDDWRNPIRALVPIEVLPERKG